MAATTTVVCEDNPDAIAEAEAWIHDEARRQAALFGQLVGPIAFHRFPPSAAPKLIALGWLSTAEGDPEAWLVEHAPAIILTATQSYLPFGAEVVLA